MRILFYRLVCVLLALTMLPAGAMADAAEEYAYAQNLLAKSQWEEAATAFAALGGYEDAARLSLYCRAIAAGEAGRYDAAQQGFALLGDYRDCTLRSAYYTYRALEAAGDTDAAVTGYESMLLYLDCEARIAAIIAAEEAAKAAALRTYENTVNAVYLGKNVRLERRDFPQGCLSENEGDCVKAVSWDETRYLVYRMEDRWLYIYDAAAQTLMPVTVEENEPVRQLWAEQEAKRLKGSDEGYQIRVEMLQKQTCADYLNEWEWRMNGAALRHARVEGVRCNTVLMQSGYAGMLAVNLQTGVMTLLGDQQVRMLPDGSMAAHVSGAASDSMLMDYTMLDDGPVMLLRGTAFDQTFNVAYWLKLPDGTRLDLGIHRFGYGPERMLCSAAGCAVVYKNYLNQPVYYIDEDVHGLVWDGEKMTMTAPDAADKPEFYPITLTQNGDALVFADLGTMELYLMDMKTLATQHLPGSQDMQTIMKYDLCYMECGALMYQQLAREYWKLVVDE